MPQRRQPPRERFEVRYVLPGPERPGTPWKIRVPVSWHLKKERAILAARCAAANSSGDLGAVHVVWTHPEDKQLGGWIDDAMLVWSTEGEDE